MHHPESNYDKKHTSNQSIFSFDSFESYFFTWCNIYRSLLEFFDVHDVYLYNSVGVEMFGAELMDKSFHDGSRCEKKQTRTVS
jgi:hypothetical protein